jgi:uncharacterized protein with HEPN domain
MNQAKRLRLADYLGHMLEAVNRCQAYVHDMDEATFMADQRTQDAVIRTFEVLGEAANNIRKNHPEFGSTNPNIPLGQAVGMRNVLSHGYFQVDLPAVWASIHADLPPLGRALRSALDVLPTR